MSQPLYHQQPAAHGQDDLLDAWARALGAPQEQACTCENCGSEFRSAWIEQFCQRCAKAMTRVLTRGM